MLGAITIPIYATNNYDQTEYIIKQTEMQHILVGDTPQLEILKSFCFVGEEASIFLIRV